LDEPSEQRYKSFRVGAATTTQVIIGSISHHTLLTLLEYEYRCTEYEEQEQEVEEEVEEYGFTEYECDCGDGPGYSHSLSLLEAMERAEVIFPAILNAERRRPSAEPRASGGGQDGK